MVRIDEKFMEQAGLTEMPEPEKQAFMEHAEQELELRVGKRLAAELTPEQLKEFEGITSQVEAVRFLDRNVPTFRDLVREVYQEFLAEVQRERESILE